MKNDWRRMKIREICELVNGRAYSKDELLAQGKYRVLRVGNLFSNTKWYYSNLELEGEKYCNNGDLLYSWSASFGPHMWDGETTIFHYHIWRVVPDERLVDKRFLFMFFLWDKERIKKDQGTGTTMIHVSKGSMEDREVQIPSLDAQRRIVGILEEAFDAIAAAKAIAERNLRNAGEVFKSHVEAMFVRGGGAWSVKSLGAIASFRNGINYTKDSRGERVRVVGVKDFQNRFLMPSDNLETVTIDGALNQGDVLKKGDILVVRSNGNMELIGRSILVGDIADKISHSGFTIRVRLSAPDVLPEYLCHFMKSGVSRKQLIEGGTGTNIKSLNQQTLANLAIPMGPVSEQETIVERINEASRGTKHLESIYQRKLAALDELKQALLHQAFTGQLQL